MNYNTIIILPLFTLFLISFLIGNAATNLVSTLLLAYLLIIFFKSKNNIKNILIDKINIRIGICFSILSLYVLINSLYALESVDSIFRAITFIKSILVIFLFYHFINNDLKNVKVFSNIFLFFLSYIIFTTIFQSITGESFFREFYPTDNRLSGPFGDELVVGTVLSKLSFLTFYILNNIMKINKIIYFLIIALISYCIIISGERNALILYLIYISIYFLILTIQKKNLKIFFNFILVISIILSVFAYNIKKSNYFDHYSKNKLDQLLYQEGSEYFQNKILLIFDRHVGETLDHIREINESDYYKLFKSGYMIWKENIFLGVGLKNFRNECPLALDNLRDKDLYSCNMHPHNFLLELLAEIGVFGLVLFVFFFTLLIKKFFLKRDYLAWLTIFIQLTPLVNSSFFSTFNINIFLVTFMLVIMVTSYNKQYQDLSV